ncbi:hypothetical protein ANRL1_02090 [Anaerolineae bacterium]|nr:hypothetical protein ANRL1_02090 [Anaerolineae bacterium]
MSEQLTQEELLSRLQFLLAAARLKLSGAELALVVFVTLEQGVSALELNLTRQGYKRARDALEQRQIFCPNGAYPQLHPEACAKFGVTKIEDNSTGIDLLRKLADGSFMTRSARKNLYQCNSDGLPASEDESTILFENLKDAVVHIASWLEKMHPDDVLQEWVFPQRTTREMQMRGMASIVQGYLDGRLSRAWPGAIESALAMAIRSVRPEYPKVLDPHRVLDRFRAGLRARQDKRAHDLAVAGQLMANNSKQANAVPMKGDGAGGGRSPAA